MMPFEIKKSLFSLRERNIWNTLTKRWFRRKVKIVQDGLDPFRMSDAQSVKAPLEPPSQRRDSVSILRDRCFLL